MTPNRRRGAHAARVDTAFFVGNKRATGDPAAPRAQGQGANGGKRVNALRSRPRLLKVAAVVLVLAFTAVGFTGFLSSPSAEPTVQAFLLAWQQESYAAAAALTTGKPEQVATELRNAFRGLDAASFTLTMGPIRQSGSTATARFTASVNLGQNGAPWVYGGQFALAKAGGGWKVVWSPSVICPGLRPGLRLAMVSSAPHRKPLLDAGRRPLQTPSVAYVAGVWPGQLRHPVATANALGRVTGLEPTELLGWILAAPQASFQELVVFRPAKYHRLARKLRRVPGLTVRAEHLRLFSSIAPAVVGAVGTEIAGALRNQGVAYRPGATVGLTGLQHAYQAQLAGTPTTMVITENRAGHQVQVLKSWNRPAPHRGQDHARLRHPDRREPGGGRGARFGGRGRGAGLHRPHPGRVAARRPSLPADRRAGRALPAGGRVHHRVNRRAARQWPGSGRHSALHQRQRRGRADVPERPGGTGPWAPADVRPGFHARLRDRVQRPVGEPDRP